MMTACAIKSEEPFVDNKEKRIGEAISHFNIH